MARRPRVDAAGFHHVVNRGVARCRVFRSSEDKEKFLQILCKACDIYKVNIHDYCLMDNHYHIIVESTSENLSLFMRQINSNYAIYFNRKHKRSGHLWQGRYKSWYILKEEYLYTLFRYVEHNPIKARIATRIGEYPFTLLATLLDTDKEVIPCAQHSKLKKELHHEGIQEHLEMALSIKELKELKKRQKRKIIPAEHGFKQEKDKMLEDHFSDIKNTTQRDSAILQAIKDGYKQAEIARHLKVSSALISKVFRGA